MAATSSDLPASSAGLAAGHRAFQEFLLAGERHVNGDFKRPGAEARFARFYGVLPKNVQANVRGYFRRQALLDISQRAALLGPLVKLDISQPLNPRTANTLVGFTSTVRSELDALSDRSLTTPSRAFKLVPSVVDVEAADAVDAAKLQGVTQQAPKNAPPRGVKHIDLLLQEVTVEDSNDGDWFHADTDTVHLAITSISETGAVESVLNKFGSRHEGNLIKFPDTVLSTINLNTINNTFPRTFSFKIDAIEKDDGTYNAVLKEAQKYIQDNVDEQLIAMGLVAAGKYVGVPIPPQVAAFVASYLKGWFDDAIDWLFDLFDNDDDLVGSRTRMVTLPDDEFQFNASLPFFSGPILSKQGPPPLKGFPFTYVFSGSGGRWRVKFCLQLR